MIEPPGPRSSPAKPPSMTAEAVRARRMSQKRIVALFAGGKGNAVALQSLEHPLPAVKFPENVRLVPGELKE